jgi:hypothetical protein
MKKVILDILQRSLLLSLLLLLTACGKNTEESLNKSMPWKATVTADGYTKVLDVDIGKATFKEIMFKLQLLAEPALFETADGKLSLEAYFGKKRFGALEARLIAEMDADQTLLKQMLDNKVGDREATPSNLWKYRITVKSTKIANDLRVWRLIYLPISDYEIKQMKFFGEPAEKLKISETAEYWLYPTRGMALLYDTAGKEIFYFVAPKEFQRLKDSLPKEAVIKIQ